jgi:PAS domain S-box-containing protein
MQEIIKQLPAVIFECAINPRKDAVFTYISDAAPDLFGVTPEQVKSDNHLLYSLIHINDLAMFRQAFRQLYPAEKTGIWRGRGLIRNNVKELEFRFRDQVTEDQGILRRGIIQEAVVGDAAPFEQAKGYEALLEKLPVGVVTLFNNRITFSNSQAHLIFGAKPKELVGLEAMQFVHPDYASGIAHRLKEVSEGHSVPLVEEKLIRRDGNIIDVETMAFPFTYRGKTAIHLIFRDITEKKQAEVHMRRSETLFTQLFENVPMAVVLLDESGKVAEINRGFEEMFGYEKNELRGKNLNDFIVPEDLRSEGIDLNKLIASNRVVTIESVRKHRSGKLVNVILCGVPVLLDNEAIGIYGVYVDISDRKKVEEELKIRNAELDNFVYKVSHDLRAPLSSVLGLVNLSTLQGNTDNPTEYISIIGKKVQALDNFISDVLSHSKNLKMEVAIGPVDLNKIIDQTFIDLSYLNGAQQTKRVIKIEGIDFYSDYWRVSEIFRNLISNAIKYRKTDTNESEINIRIHVDHISADITFSDNGIGIKETSLKRIFEMFYRGTEQAEGSGIGLYIVKNAVDKLGGEIRVSSTAGEGTQFHILLPNRINSIINMSPILTGP